MRPVIRVNMVAMLQSGDLINYLKLDYLGVLWNLGAFPLMIPSIADDPGYLEEYLDRIDGLLLIGGPDYHPALYHEAVDPHCVLKRFREQNDILLAQQALTRGVPLLGVCAGCQLLNIATGGKLLQHLPDAEKRHWDIYHQATVVQQGHLSSCLDLKTGEQFHVNSFHHQAVDAGHLGEGVSVTAFSYDGTVEAIERPGDQFTLGVQFHPEEMPEYAPRIFGALLQAAYQYNCLRRKHDGY